MIVTTLEEERLLREGGKHHAHILEVLKEKTRPGVTTFELEECARKEIARLGDAPSFLNYRPKGAPRAFPGAICVSFNDEIVHGIANEVNRIVKDGDLVTLDLGLIHEGMFTDAAITVIAGKGSKEAYRLVNATEQALTEGLSEARTGNRMGDIGYAINAVARKEGLSVFKDLVGHGVGKGVHEDPYVPNYGKRGVGVVLREGLVLAVEPMFGTGSDQIKTLPDQWTYATKDGSLSAHFEHTIIVRKDGPVIVTALS